MKKPELLAPAGTLEKLKFSVQYGADAVYIAGKQYGLRAFAGNFTPEQMAEGIAFAHQRQVKVYVTVNVFAHNDEMALGAVEAIGNRDIVVVGFDATDDALAAIQKGRMAATVAQKPDLMGATAVETAISLVNGETVEKEIPVEVELITK